jgi:hypothetical protein
VTTAGLSYVGSGDTQPLVLGGGLQHLRQKLAVIDLELVSLLERDMSTGNPIGQRVAHALELPEPGKPWAPRRRPNTSIDLQPWKGLDREA